MATLIDTTNQPFSREPEALALKCRHYGIDAKAGGNPLDGYWVMGTYNGRVVIFRTPAQVHKFCRGLR